MNKFDQLFDAIDRPEHYTSVEIEAMLTEDVKIMQVQTVA